MDCRTLRPDQPAFMMVALGKRHANRSRMPCFRNRFPSKPKVFVANEMSLTASTACYMYSWSKLDVPVLTHASVQFVLPRRHDNLVLRESGEMHLTSSPSPFPGSVTSREWKPWCGDHLHCTVLYDILNICSHYGHFLVIPELLLILHG